MTCIYRYSFYRTVDTPYRHYNNLNVLYREIIAVCSELYTKSGNVLFGQNVEFLSVKICGT